jgi:hypothetical protein
VVHDLLVYAVQVRVHWRTSEARPRAARAVSLLLGRPDDPQLARRNMVRAVATVDVARRRMPRNLDQVCLRARWDHRLVGTDPGGEPPLMPPIVRGPAEIGAAENAPPPGRLEDQEAPED